MKKSLRFIGKPPCVLNIGCRTLSVLLQYRKIPVHSSIEPPMHGYRPAPSHLLRKHSIWYTLKCITFLFTLSNQPASLQSGTTSPQPAHAISPQPARIQPAISPQSACRNAFHSAVSLVLPYTSKPKNSRAKYEHIFSFSKWMFSQTQYVCAVAHASSRVAISHSPKSHTVSPSTTSLKPAFSTMSTSPRGARQDALLRLQGLNQSGDGLVP